MVLRMARPARRSDGSFFLFRKRVPADAQAKKRGGHVVFSFPSEGVDGQPIRVTTAIGSEIKFSLRTRSPDVAKARNGLAEAQFQAFCEGVRRGPTTLNHEQVIALAGVWYRQWVAMLRETPGSPAIWQHWVRLVDSGAVSSRRASRQLLRRS